MAPTSKTTKNHKEIKKWAELRKGRPAIVRGIEDDEGTGLLRIIFEESSEKDLKEISWDEFFKTFDDRNLTFLYQEEKDGKLSRFFKFLKKETAHS